MKKQFRFCLVAVVVFCSVLSFVYLNYQSTTEFVWFDFSKDFPSFNVSSSTLPNVEAVKSTLIFIKELVLFDL